MQTYPTSRRSALFAALVIASLAFAPAGIAQQATQDAIAGKWEADDGKR